MHIRAVGIRYLDQSLTNQFSLKHHFPFNNFFGIGARASRLRPDLTAVLSSFKLNFIYYVLIFNHVRFGESNRVNSRNIQLKDISSKTISYLLLPIT
ncbi:hypothetical protein SAMN00777080_3502 [Aquiflexum balticum DSM 16537]|uniref:Uncharacterized protein n=1 Tax=Aquiflexum balticum DSM 16537 TaxID=758820 RepID=A0A1W2H8F5_9BACT|nr:hypothetical protein SAMN00777080_3502 [Aquiflexum balticum DSM 16537]